MIYWFDPAANKLNRTSTRARAIYLYPSISLLKKDCKCSWTIGLRHSTRKCCKRVSRMPTSAIPAIRWSIKQALTLRDAYQAENPNQGASGPDNLPQIKALQRVSVIRMVKSRKTR